MNKVLEITKEGYRVIDEPHYCCDEFMFRYYCVECDELWVATSANLTTPKPIIARSKNET